MKTFRFEIVSILLVFFSGAAMAFQHVEYFGMRLLAVEMNGVWHYTATDIRALVPFVFQQHVQPIFLGQAGDSLSCLREPTQDTTRPRTRVRMCAS